MAQSDYTRVKKFFETPLYERVVDRQIPPLLKEFIESEVNFVKSRCKKNFDVLEVGCGFGRIMKVISANCRSVAGIDYSRHQLESAKRNTRGLKNVTLHLEDSTNLSFGNGSFDIVFCVNNMLGNMPDKSKIRTLREMARVCKAGGLAIVHVLSPNAKTSQIANYTRLGTHIKKVEKYRILLEEGLVTEMFTKRKISKIFSEARLKPQISKICRIGYLCLARKNITQH